MDLRQLRYLVAVADAGSFTAGARRAFVSQPTLSQAITALEAELGTELFARSSRGAVPTTAGLRALTHARTVLRETEALKTAGRPPEPTRPIRLGLLPTLPAPMIADALAKLGALLPTLSWRTEDAPLTTLRRRLAAGRVDLVLTNIEGPMESGHRRHELGRDTMRLAFRRGQEPDAPITPEVLHRAPLIVRTHCEYLEPASRILDERRIRPIVVSRTDSDTRALELVAAGLGACLMPDSFHSPDVSLLEVQGIDLSRRLGLEWIDGGAFPAPAELSP